jgi:hypothetical protein
VQSFVSPHPSGFPTSPFNPISGGMPDAHRIVPMGLSGAFNAFNRVDTDIDVFEDEYSGSYNFPMRGGL